MKEFQKAIDDFCEATKWASKSWKDQAHIKALFDLQTKPNK